MKLELKRKYKSDMNSDSIEIPSSPKPFDERFADMKLRVKRMTGHVDSNVQKYKTLKQSVSN
jgi:hypothetical protein